MGDKKQSAAGSRPDRELLTPAFCQKAVVDTTPGGSAAFKDDPTQDLSELGIVDSDSAAQHRANLQDFLHTRQFVIKQRDIVTGPGVQVHECAVSVLGHAH